MRDEFLNSVDPSALVNAEIISLLEKEALRMVRAVNETNP